jgi:cytosine/adenosine deaminase-related metal-dependent hydrolase
MPGGWKARRATRSSTVRALVIPGLVDAHAHFYGTLIPGLIDRLPLDVRRPFLGACTDGWTERDTWVTIRPAIQLGSAT